MELTELLSAESTADVENWTKNVHPRPSRPSVMRTVRPSRAAAVRTGGSFLCQYRTYCSTARVRGCSICIRSLPSTRPSCRNDVFYGSLHGDPKQNYPYFLGYADERGVGVGEGYNRNCPLPSGSGAKTWFEALALLLSDIERYGPDELVVSLGVDAFEGDPISSFKLSSGDFLKLGEHQPCSSSFTRRAAPLHRD